MARVTIEDSLAEIRKFEGGGIFHMIMIAAYRAHQLQHGALPKVPENGDKPTVIALREIAAGHYDFTNEVIPKKDVYGQIVEEIKEEEKNDVEDQ
jgi:DNA-directed RNA polymerase subunit omega